MSTQELPAILVVNAGSSSVKFALFGIDDSTVGGVILEGEVDGIGANPRLTVIDAAGTHTGTFAIELQSSDGPHAAALDAVLSTLHKAAGDYAIAAVGHRVVHGGTHYAEPVVITPAVLDSLASLVPLAPLHQPHNLAAIDAVARRLPEVMQVACFDTAFHTSCSPLAQRFALPRALHDGGIRRYGFHGLSYEYIAQQLPHVAGTMLQRVIVAHLGAGASLCAMNAGRSVATTMGFTALDGLMMGTRCGNIDPGVLLHLLTQSGMDVAALTRLLYRESGLLGVSGISADMRELLGSNEPAAEEAVALFCYRVVREIGSLMAALGGLDALVFTAGIGAHAAPVRQKICDQLQWMNLKLDEGANATNCTRVSRPESAISVWVIPTDEQGMIAKHTRALMA